MTAGHVVICIFFAVIFIELIRIESMGHSILLWIEHVNQKLNRKEGLARFNDPVSEEEAETHV